VHEHSVKQRKRRRKKNKNDNNFVEEKHSLERIARRFAVN